MSLTTRHTALLIGEGTVFSSTPTLVDENPALSEEGWDSNTLTYAARRASLTAEECAALFPIGAQIGSRKWWITGAKPQRAAPGFWLIEVACKGWGATKPAKVKVGAAAESQSGKNVTAPNGSGGSALYASVATHENTPTLSVSYLAENLDTVSNTDEVGKAKAIPGDITIAIADSVWTSLPEFTYHWPNGWVLMGSSQDRLPGTDVGLVTDDYRYVRDKTPGGA